MTIIKNEVLTLTTIALNTKDIVNVIKTYKERESLQVCYPDAFKKMDIDDSTIGNLRNILMGLNHLGNGDTYTVVAKVLGFDGWKHAGFYDDNKGKYILTVYSNGDTLN